MEHYLNDKAGLATNLRDHPTPSERVLWSAIEQDQILGRAFKRQVVILGYIVDFYCPSERLIIEVDGAVHREEFQRQIDAKRNAILRNHGYRILRFTADAVLNSIDLVIGQITDSIKPRTKADGPDKARHVSGFSPISSVVWTVFEEILDDSKK